jgi:hypothetical protein
VIFVVVYLTKGTNHDDSVRVNMAHLLLVN